MKVLGWLISVLAALAGFGLLLAAIAIPLILGASISCFMFAALVNPSIASRIRWPSSAKRLKYALACVVIGLGFLVITVVVRDGKSSYSEEMASERDQKKVAEYLDETIAHTKTLADDARKKAEAALTKFLPPNYRATYEYKAVGSDLGGAVRICGTMHAGSPTTSIEFIFFDDDVFKDQPLRIKNEESTEKGWMNLKKEACEYEYSRVFDEGSNVELGKLAIQPK